jgi:hypothetical protein
MQGHRVASYEAFYATLVFINVRYAAFYVMFVFVNDRYAAFYYNQLWGGI